MVYVSDENRIQVFGSDGTFITKWTVASSIIYGIVVVGDMIYVSEYNNGRITLYG